MQQKSKQNQWFKPANAQKHRLFNVKKKKRTISICSIDQANKNPVYRALRVQRDAKTVLDFILQTEATNRTDHLKPINHDNRFKQEPNRSISPVEGDRCKSLAIINSFKQKVNFIVNRTKKVGEELIKNKQRIRILDRFNSRVDKYCSYLPEDPEQDEINESQLANDQLIRLCNQELFPTQNLHKRAVSLLHYKQPKLPPTKLRKIRERYRTSINEGEQSINPLKRLLTLNAS